ncbi:hypothetical protein E2C01_087800 [Portunus trituberculatus]|uniref:Uncharacterized protein n=1 Tax=Portunus trituberculatus TaxID=210409 RepID=A0A5B7JF21_PORTR|nr:hypothetical protein [Portunus trituberculatus]
MAAVTAWYRLRAIQHLDRHTLQHPLWRRSSGSGGEWRRVIATTVSLESSDATPGTPTTTTTTPRHHHAR